MAVKTGLLKAFLKQLPKIVLIAFSLLLLSNQDFLKLVMQLLFPEENKLIYTRASLLRLSAEHLLLVLLSSTLAVMVGVGLGIFGTRTRGKDFLPFLQDLGSLSQTFPPVAVLALSVPLLGFQLKPALAALFLYSLLPIMNNTIAGLKSLPREIIHAAAGMGLTPLQQLVRIELPYAARIILTGIRTAVVINVGTATLGAVVGAGGLGSPIIAGLAQTNPAFIFQGAFGAAALAFALDWIFTKIEKLLYSPAETGKSNI